MYLRNMYLRYENNSSELTHHGIKGQKWGVRRFQNADGTRTAAGKKRYKSFDEQAHEDYQRLVKADRALAKVSRNNSITNRVLATKAVNDLKKNKINKGKIETYSEKGNRFKSLLSGSEDDGYEVFDGYTIKPSKTTSALRKAHLMPKNEHGQFDKIKNEYTKDYKRETKKKYADAKTSLKDIDKNSDTYKLAKNAVDTAKREYVSVKRGNKLRVGVSRPGLFPNMRADMVQNNFDVYKRRGYSDNDAAYAAYGNYAVKKFFGGTPTIAINGTMIPA